MYSITFYARLVKHIYVTIHYIDNSFDDFGVLFKRGKVLQVELSIRAAKYLRGMSEPAKGRITKALQKLSLDPPQGDVKSLINRDGYRLKVGDYRILFDIEEDTISVYAIAPRGQAYKGGF
jgi:mRNA interferase RelE/StbE